MRFGAGFSLVGLLVVVAIIVLLQSQSAGPTLKAGKQARQQAEVVSGRGPDGLPAAQSVKLEPKTKDGKTTTLAVTDVVAGGALDQFYGLQKGDEIVQIGDLRVPDWGGDELAMSMVYEAAQRQFKLVVLRNGQNVTLEPKGAAGVNRSGGPLGPLNLPGQ